MASITFLNATLTYPGADSSAVSDLNLHIEDGELMVLVGPSGCGKSTTLRMLAGLEDVTSGTILIGDRDVTRLPSKDRDIAMVFQNYALYPHMSVEDNMGFALKMAKVRKDERKRRVQQAAEILGLTPYLARKPKALSGGQRQRVAMGRAIVREPQVFCMDEPLSNLDAKMRVQTRGDIARLQADLGVTTVYVTHDQVEAMTMGDRVAVMKDGVLQQVDVPLKLYDEPANAFVAGFIGSPPMSLFRGEVISGRAALGDYPLHVAAPGDGPITVGVRPEGWRLVSSQTVGAVPVDVTVVEELGADAFAYGTVSLAGEPCPITVRVPGRGAAAKGDRIHVVAEPTSVHLFDVATGLRVQAAPALTHA